MSERPQAQLDDLVRLVGESAKYRAVSTDLIRSIGQRELSARRNLKAALKATKNKLHQIAGAYLDSRPTYDLWLEQLAAAWSAQSLGASGAEPFRQACLRIMRHHASTRERLCCLDQFYTTTLAGVPPIRSVLDLACGLNPLALPWMPLAAGATYLACDLYSDMVAFLNSFLAMTGMSGRAYVCDLVSAPPRERVDLALVLKVIPPLEQQEKGSGMKLLRALNAERMLVSFPSQSLGGRERGMVASYAQRFCTLLEQEGWPSERFVFATEQVFLIQPAVAI